MFKYKTNKKQKKGALFYWTFYLIIFFWLPCLKFSIFFFFCCCSKLIMPELPGSYAPVVTFKKKRINYDFSASPKSANLLPDSFKYGYQQSKWTSVKFISLCLSNYLPLFLPCFHDRLINTVAIHHFNKHRCRCTWRRLIQGGIYLKRVPISIGEMTTKCMECTCG